MFKYDKIILIKNIGILLFTGLLFLCYPQTRVWASGIFLPELTPTTCPLVPKLQEVGKEARENLRRIAVTGAYQTPTRFYAPTIGRFTQPDPLSRLPIPAMQRLAGPNPFTYVRNNPARFVDPLGLYEQQAGNGNYGLDPYYQYSDPTPLNLGLNLQDTIGMAHTLVQAEMVREVVSAGNANEYWTPWRGWREDISSAGAAQTIDIWDVHSARVNGDPRTSRVKISISAQDDLVTALQVQSGWDYSRWEGVWTPVATILSYKADRGWEIPQGQLHQRPEGITPGESFVPGTDWLSELINANPNYALLIGGSVAVGSSLTGPAPFGLPGGAGYLPEEGGVATGAPGISIPGVSTGTGPGQGQDDRKPPPGGAKNNNGQDVLVLGRGPLERLQRLAEQEGGRISTTESTNPQDIFKQNYRDMRSADKIIQYMDNVPRTQADVAAQGGKGQYSRAEAYMIDSLPDLAEKTIRK